MQGSDTHDYGNDGGAIDVGKKSNVTIIGCHFILVLMVGVDVLVLVLALVWMRWLFYHTSFLSLFHVFSRTTPTMVVVALFTAVSLTWQSGTPTSATMLPVDTVVVERSARIRYVWYVWATHLLEILDGLPMALHSTCGVYCFLDVLRTTDLDSILFYSSSIVRPIWRSIIRLSGTTLHSSMRTHSSVMVIRISISYLNSLTPCACECECECECASGCVCLHTLSGMARHCIWHSAFF